MNRCTFAGCQETVSKSGYTLCYKHWKVASSQPHAAAPHAASAPPPRSDAALSATALGERLKLPNHKINQILAELGWISREKKGWVPTQQGLTLGAIQKEHFQTGVPYVQWPDTILTNKALIATVRSVIGEAEPSPVHDTTTEVSFRERFVATHRTTDGHWVRSTTSIRKHPSTISMTMMDVLLCPVHDEWAIYYE